MKARTFAAAEPIRPGPIEELSGVRLTLGLDLGASGWLPAGSHGTVVFVYAEGEAYEVEFAEPFHALLILAAAEIEPVPGKHVSGSSLIADSFLSLRRKSAFSMAWRRPRPMCECRARSSSLSTSMLSMAVKRAWKKQRGA